MKIVRRVSLTVLACLGIGGVCFWVIVLEPIYRYGQCNLRIRTKFESLAKKRPPIMTPTQWQSIVGWTLNAHSNCFGYDSHWPADSTGFTDAVKRLEEFEKELNQRLDGPVNLQTIDWIWDEIVRLGYHGRKYSDHFRPTSPERLKECEHRTSMGWNINVE